MKLVLSIFVILVIVIGCKKDKSFKPQGIYNTGSFYNFSPVELYTKNGIISDTMFIKDYLQRNAVWGSAMYFNFKTVPEPVTFNGTINFEPNDKVTLYDGTTIKAEVTQLSSDRIILSEIDSSLTLSNPPASRCDVLQNIIRQYIPVRVNLGPWQKFKRLFPILINNEALRIPYISYNINNGGTCIHGGGDWNVLQTDLVVKLINMDTVVVQMKYLPLVRQ